MRRPTLLRITAATVATLALSGCGDDVVDDDVEEAVQDTAEDAGETVDEAADAVQEDAEG